MEGDSDDNNTIVIAISVFAAAMSVIVVTAVLVARACKAAGRSSSGATARAEKPVKKGTIGIRRTTPGRGNGRTTTSHVQTTAVGIVIKVDEPVALPDGF